MLPILTIVWIYLFLIITQFNKNAQIYNLNSHGFMKGLFQHKTAGQQLFLLLSISLLSFFVIGMMGTYALTIITGITLEQVAALDTIDPKHPWLPFFIRGMQAVQFIGLFLIPSWFAGKYFTAQSTITYLGLRKPNYSGFWFVGAAAILIALPMVQWLGEVNRTIEFPAELTNWIRSKEDEVNETVKALLSRHSVKDLFLNLFFVAGLAAVGEELLFRGVIQRIFVRQFGQAWPAIIFSAFLFAALHMQFYGFFPRFALGILLGAIYWYSGSLWVAILAHFLYDATLITLVYFNPSMLNEETVVAPDALLYAGLVSALMVTMNLHWMINHGNPVSDEQIETEETITKE
ncbi:MAG: CPBP family intramembrane metalloprotease [Bacteroidetes bacterium]|nr:CPBP family intramembrane metalloprotease [Bacteroidota bacterium]